MDTIAAVSTAPVPSAIGIIRLSGKDAGGILGKVFSGVKDPVENPREMVYGRLLTPEGRVLDRALAVFFEAGASFTGESMAEIHCHGSPAVLEAGLRAVFHHGARQALPGEFTRRAFLHGRIDLAGAEAVADLISAETEEAAVAAASQLGGALSREVSSVYDGLCGLLAHFQAVVDYPDEDIDDFLLSNALNILNSSQSRLCALERSYERGRAVREGVRCAIIGRPNVGKSSLLNAILGYDRAIVSALPGTTRDVVEDRARVGGVLLRLSDTAGIREGAGEIEALGIGRSLAEAKGAAFVICVVDGASGLCGEDMAAIDACRGKRSILVINKCDLPQSNHNFAETERTGGFEAVCRVSALTGEGLPELERAVAAMFSPRDGADGAMLTNARHLGACLDAKGAVGRAIEALRQGFTPDAVLLDVEGAMESLGLITGKTAGDEILNMIFDRFCVGK